MKIFIAASEMTPFAKTGGLGDVIGALASSLHERGHDVTCCIPFYRSVADCVSNVMPVGLTLSIPLGSRTVTGDVLELRVSDRLRVLFVRRDEFFDRSELYQTRERPYEDNAERFLFFSKAVVELAGYNRFRPDILHCHDWQTAFAPVQTTYRRQVRGPEFAARTVFTIHNIAYQGMFWSLDFPLTNLPGEFFTPGALEFYDQMNLMKGGIVFSDAITTVSKKYAAEILTEEGGFGLDPVLNARRDGLVGILNGADYRTWNPATDAALKQTYSADDLTGKRACRTDLLRHFGLELDERMPVAAVISRLTELKGLDLLIEAAEELVELGLAMVVLGRGAEKYEEAMTGLAKRFPERIGFRCEMNEPLAHRMLGGADVLLVPSKIEPCGLTQMYALKYGTIPVVHATGGLDDTVSPFDAATGQGNGFKFAEYSSEALVDAVRQALSAYKERNTWQRLMRNAMACDFSWEAAAREYERQYAALL